MYADARRGVKIAVAPTLQVLGAGVAATRGPDESCTRFGALGDRDRKEIAGGAVYALSSCVAAYGSIGRTFATLDENGAGTTIGAGVSICFRGR